MSVAGGGGGAGVAWNSREWCGVAHRLVAGMQRVQNACCAHTP